MSLVTFDYNKNEDGTIDYYSTYIISTEYEGRVLALLEKNYYDDSDFYACVLTEDNKLKSICYDSTRYGSSCNASVDATKDVIDKANEIIYNATLDEYRNDNTIQAAKVEIGKYCTIKVTKRHDVVKKSIAQNGATVKVLSKAKYAPHQYPNRDKPTSRIVETIDGNKFWIDESKLTVINPEKYLWSEEFMENQAKQAVANGVRSFMWRYLF
jgi:hypothetical protein